MKCKVLISFADKHTGALYTQGASVDFSAKRIDEILSVGKFIEVLPEQEKKEEKPKAKKKG